MSAACSRQRASKSRVHVHDREHLKQQGVEVSPTVNRLCEYQVGRVPVTLLMTRHNDEARPNRRRPHVIWRSSRA